LPVGVIRSLKVIANALSAGFQSPGMNPIVNVLIVPPRSH
jgi:hypothetical protein